MKTLYLQKRGCDFNNPDDRTLLNHRYYFYINDKKYGLTHCELSQRGWHYRTTNKRTGERLKKPIQESCNDAVFDFQYLSMNGGTYGIIDNEHSTKNRIPYTAAAVLEFINNISIDQYDNIAVIDEYINTDLETSSQQLNILIENKRGYYEKAKELINKYNNDYAICEGNDLRILKRDLYYLFDYIIENEFYNFLNWNEYDNNINIDEYSKKSSKNIDAAIDEFINRNGCEILTAEQKKQKLIEKAKQRRADLKRYQEYYY